MQLIQRFSCLLLLFFTIAISSGCSTKTTIKQILQNGEPLLISKENVNAIKTLIIFPAIDKKVTDEEIIYVSNALDASGRFIIISPNKFIQEAKKEGVSVDNMTTSDRVDLSKIIGKKLSADAVLFIKVEGTEMSANLASAFTSRVDVTGNNIFTIREVSSGDIIWEQIQKVDMSVSGLKHSDSRKIIKAQYDPLISNLLSSFQSK